MDNQQRNETIRIIWTGKTIDSKYYQYILSEYVDGKVVEYTPLQVQQWCEAVGLTPVEECYFGKAKDLYPDLDTSNYWNENFIERLSNDKNFYMELNSPHCNNKVPHEGLVIKPLDRLGTAFKLKSFKFLNKEQTLLDKGEEDIEENA